MVSHRSGVWKQQNKTHKTGRHRSKGQIGVENKGKVSVKSLSKKLRKDAGKANRKHHAQQIRTQKKDEVLSRKRGLGSANSPPHVVAVIPLHRLADVNQIVQGFKSYQEHEGQEIHNAELSAAGFVISVPKLKYRFNIICPGSASLTDVLDCGLVADTIVFVLAANTEEPIDNTGRTFLSNLFAEGFSASVQVINGLQNIAVKRRADIKKNIIKHTEKFFPNTKLYSVDTLQETQILLRTISEQKRKAISLRHKRPYMMADRMSFNCAENEEFGELSVTGFVRSENLDVNRLVHIVGWGDFQIKCINAANDITSAKSGSKKKRPDKIDSMDVDNVTATCTVDMESVETLATSDPSTRQDLNPVAQVDPLDAEQTWPTEDEIMEAEKEQSKRKLTKRVPKGTSEYQSAWILDSDEDWEETSDVEMDDAGLEPVDDQASDDSDVEEYEEIPISEGSHQVDTASQYDAEMGSEDLQQQAQRYKEERANQQFPDEVDTPFDVKAKDRFQKYRGLKSFRSSPWDSKENLPLDYARIFQFQDFNRTRKRVRDLQVDDSIKPGMYVTLVIENVPRSYVDTHSTTSPVILFGMMPHEQKMSVIHIALKRSPGLYEDVSIRSKDELVFQLGFRRFRARPIFSQHTSGNKHKVEKFFSTNSVVIASFYGQITFPPANVLAFKEKNGELLPIASGTLYKADPDRIIVKRIVLSGHPFRINKRSATVRYMFFNHEDVNWFKPVELRTKWGRRGHIKDSLGTHGHMKCVFDAQLISQDTVLMNLYKRVFPKWNYELINPTNKIKMVSTTPSIDSDSRSREVTFEDEFFN